MLKMTVLQFAFLFSTPLSYIPFSFSLTFYMINEIFCIISLFFLGDTLLILVISLEITACLLDLLKSHVS